MSDERILTGKFESEDKMEITVSFLSGETECGGGTSADVQHRHHLGSRLLRGRTKPY